MSAYLPPIITLVVCGVTVLFQLWLFAQTVRKDRLQQVRTAIAELAGAAYSMSDVRRDEQAALQRQLNQPLGQPSKAPPPESEQARSELLFLEREKRMLAAFAATRDRFFAAKAKLIVVSNDRQMQAHAEVLWKLIDGYQPVVMTQSGRTDAKDPAKAIEQLRSEIDAWVLQAANLTGSLWGWDP